MSRGGLAVTYCVLREGRKDRSLHGCISILASRLGQVGGGFEKKNPRLRRTQH
jgi:hypothetical protein